MPRWNHPRPDRRRPDWTNGKPKGRKRPRRWHRGRDQGVRYLDATERLGQTGEAA